MSSERSNLTLTALLIGVPVLVGASCYYIYYSQRSSANGKAKSSPNGDPSTSIASGGDKKQASIVSNDKNKELSPLEQIRHIKEAGNNHFKRNNYDAAIEHYSRAIELSEQSRLLVEPSELAIFYQNRAACNETLGNFEAVVADCSKAIELKKTYSKAYLRRAKAYEKLHDFDKAMVDAFCTNLLEKFQNQNSIAMTESIVQASSKAKAAEAMKTHKFDWAADNQIKTYFAAFPHDPIRETLGSDVTISSSSQLQPLLDEANKPENENDPYSLLVRGSCLSLMGDTKGALSALERVIEFDDEQCSAKLKANAMIKKSAVMITDPNALNQIEKDLEVATEILEQAAKVAPDNPDVYFHLAQTMTLLERPEEAINHLDKAIELHPKFHAAIAQRMLLDYKMATRGSFSNSSPEGLLKKFEVALKEHDNALEIQQIYAQALTDANCLEQADQAYVKILEQEPNDFNSLISRALLRFHLKSDPDEIAAMLREVIKTNPKSIVAFEILGSLETQQGKSGDAIELFETALKHAHSEFDYVRCYSLLDSAKSQKAAVELLGLQMM